MGKSFKEWFSKGDDLDTRTFEQQYRQRYTLAFGSTLCESGQSRSTVQKPNKSAISGHFAHVLWGQSHER